MPSNASSPPSARLALADGAVFHGSAFGAVGRKTLTQAEVVFNTAIGGYQESLTDPSYTGQILVTTFPLIGNTGVNEEDVESRKVQVAGLVVREYTRRHSNYRATGDLSSYLARDGVLGISGIDTRALTKRLRQGGAMQGVLTDRTDLSDDELVAMARKAAGMAGQNLVPLVGCSSKQTWDQTLGDWAPHAGDKQNPVRVLALDCGAKQNILRHLTQRGCEVTLVPHTITAQEITKAFESGQADGLFISNGPGDPAAVEQTIGTLREVVRGEGPAAAMPVFGICLGHQLLALALGAKTYKLPFGHRGINQPVLNLETKHVEITSQNHGFAVDEKSLQEAGGAEVTHRHLNDGTVAGLRMTDRPVFSVQHHPESSPGPHEAMRTRTRAKAPAHAKASVEVNIRA